MTPEWLRRTQPIMTGTARHLDEAHVPMGHAGADAGFTLIELMVVLLILAILLAIAIPTFLGVTKSANDRATQSNLNTALVNAKSIFQQQSQTYALAGATGATATASNAASVVASLSAAEPSLSYATGAVTSAATPATVSVAVSADGTSLMLAEQSKGTGTCWYVADNTAGSQAWAGTSTFATTAGTWYGKYLSPTTCNATSIPATGVTWQQSSFPK